MTSFLLEMLAKSVLVVAVAATVAWVKKDASAAQRHMVWSAAFLVLLLLPLVHWILPRWPVPILPNSSMHVAPLEKVRIAAAQEGEIARLGASTASPGLLTATQMNGIDKAWLFGGLWAAGFLAVLGFRCVGSVQLRRLDGGSMALEDARVKALLKQVLSEVGIGREVVVRVSSSTKVPLTWGCWRPLLVLPKEALEWPEQSLRAALLHEAGHIARYDHLSSWMAWSVCALYWPNPLVWAGARALRAAQEHAADDVVLGGGIRPAHYAGQLLELVRKLSAPPHRGAVPMARPSGLEHRLRLIVESGRDRRPLNRWAKYAGILAAGMMLAIGNAQWARAADKAADAPSADGEWRAVIDCTIFEAPADYRLDLERAAQNSRATQSVASNRLGTVPVGRDESLPSALLAPASELQSILRGLEQDKRCRLLSKKQVQVQANQEAKIEVSNADQKSFEIGLLVQPLADEGIQLSFSRRSKNILAPSFRTTHNLDLASNLCSIIRWTETSSGSVRRSYAAISLREAGNRGALPAASPQGALVKPSRAQQPRVQIESKLVSLTEEAFAKESKAGGALEGILSNQQLAGDARAIIDPEKTEAFIKRLNAVHDMEMLSMSAVTCRSEEEAVLEHIREYIFPVHSVSEKDPGLMIPDKFETKNLGHTLHVLLKVSADGQSLQLRLKPEIVDLIRHEKTERREPIFSEQKLEAEVQLRSGQTVVLHRPVAFEMTPSFPAAPKGYDKERPVEKRMVLHLVTAKILPAQEACPAHRQSK